MAQRKRGLIAREAARSFVWALSSMFRDGILYSKFQRGFVFSDAICIAQGGTCNLWVFQFLCIGSASFEGGIDDTMHHRWSS